MVVAQEKLGSETPGGGALPPLLPTQHTQCPCDSICPDAYILVSWSGVHRGV